jgi:hypothetical protein
MQPLVVVISVGVLLACCSVGVGVTVRCEFRVGVWVGGLSVGVAVGWVVGVSEGLSEAVEPGFEAEVWAGLGGGAVTKPEVGLHPATSRIQARHSNTQSTADILVFQRRITPYIPDKQDNSRPDIGISARFKGIEEITAMRPRVDPGQSAKAYPVDAACIVIHVLKVGLLDAIDPEFQDAVIGPRI